MKLLNNVKRKVALRRISKDAAKINRIRDIRNIAQVHTVGVLFVLDNEDTYKNLTQFVESLQKQGKEVKVMALFYGDIQPLYYIPKLSYDLMKSKDVNWYGRPVAEFSDSFLKNDFDVLLYYTLNENTPLDYIFALSPAKLRVSNQNDSISEYSDVIIDTREKSGLKGFMQTSLHYLSEINKEYEKQ